MVAAYAQNGHPEDALSVCSEMAFAGQRPTVATLVTVISASADIAALPQGREIHGFSWRQGFAPQDKVKTALVDMYAKSGSLRVAKRVFERLHEKRIVSWNAIITGYAMHVHAFLSGDTSHPMSDAIYAELEKVTGLVTEAGYVPTTGTVFHDVEDDEKTSME
ncbi:hypothetical protein RDABS01_015875 [Bienertia sinuspersici]